MTQTIKLFNTGSRRIEYRRGAFFKPGTSIIFPLAEGKKLKRLYKDEIKIDEDFANDYVPASAEEMEDDVSVKVKKVIIDTSESKTSKVIEKEEKKVAGKRGRPAKKVEIEETSTNNDSKQEELI